MKVNFFKTTLGKKYVMAVTGAALFIFVVLHLLGNLQVFLGPNQINAYGYFLQNAPELLWPARLGLLVLVLLHIWAALKLSAENKAARPVAYGHYQPVASTYASRTMLMSGLIIACFIVYHLLHFTVQLPAINLTGKNFLELHDPRGRHDVYQMMLLGFSNPFVSLFYIVGMALLCLHLSHGLASGFQSLGWRNKKFGRWIDGFARGAAVLIFLGYASIPLAVLLDRKLNWIHLFQ